MMIFICVLMIAFRINCPNPKLFSRVLMISMCISLTANGLVLDEANKTPIMICVYSDNGCWSYERFPILDEYCSQYIENMATCFNFTLVPQENNMTQFPSTLCIKNNNNCEGYMWSTDITFCAESNEP